MLMCASNRANEILQMLYIAELKGKGARASEIEEEGKKVKQNKRKEKKTKKSNKREKERESMKQKKTNKKTATLHQTLSYSVALNRKWKRK